MGISIQMKKSKASMYSIKEYFAIDNYKSVFDSDYLHSKASQIADFLTLIYNNSI